MKVWERPQGVTLGRPQDVIFQRPKGVGRGRPLALHREPYGDIHKTSFGDALRTSSGRNFAEWVYCKGILKPSCIKDVPCKITYRAKDARWALVTRWCPVDNMTSNGRPYEVRFKSLFIRNGRP